MEPRGHAGSGWTVTSPCSDRRSGPAFSKTQPPRGGQSDQGTQLPAWCKLSTFNPNSHLAAGPRPRSTTGTVTASPCRPTSPGEDPGTLEGKPSTWVSYPHCHGDDTHQPGELFKDVPGTPPEAKDHPRNSGRPPALGLTHRAGRRSTHLIHPVLLHPVLPAEAFGIVCNVMTQPSAPG